MKVYIRRLFSEEWSDNPLCARITAEEDAWDDYASAMLYGIELKRAGLPLNVLKKDDNEEDNEAIVFKFEVFKREPKPKDGFKVNKLFLTFDPLNDAYVPSTKSLEWKDGEIANVGDLVMEEDCAFCEERIQMHLNIANPKPNVSFPVWIRWKKGGLERA